MRFAEGLQKIAFQKVWGELATHFVLQHIFSSVTASSSKCPLYIVTSFLRIINKNLGQKGRITVRTGRPAPSHGV